uniref:Uncharacterized protein n=1 Tax=Glossina austeni TaxID=7395 RepID=A0A1A9VGK6_GLOAU
MQMFNVFSLGYIKFILWAGESPHGRTSLSKENVFMWGSHGDRVIGRLVVWSMKSTEQGPSYPLDGSFLKSLQRSLDFYVVKKEKQRKKNNNTSNEVSNYNKYKIIMKTNDFRAASAATAFPLIQVILGSGQNQ